MEHISNDNYANVIAEQQKKIGALEKKIKEAEIFQQLLCEHSGAYGGLFDINGNILLFNKKAAENLGGKPHDFIGKNVKEIFGAKLGNVVIKRLVQSAKTNKTIEAEDCMEIAGEQKYTLSKYTRLPDGFDKIKGIQVLTIDITNQKKAELEHAKIEKYYRRIIENAPEGVVIVNKDGKMVYASPNTPQICGYTANEIIDIDGAYFTHPDDLPAVLAAFEQIQNNPEKKVKLRYRFLCKNGNYRWIETTFSNLLHDEAIQGYILNFTDITESKRAIDALKESESLLKLSLETNKASVFVDNFETGEMYCSPELFIYMGYKTSEVPQSLDQFTKLNHPDDIVHVKKALDDHFSGKTEEFYAEYRLKDKTGNWRWISGKGKVVKRNAKNEAVTLVGISHDITQRRLAEEEVKESEKRLKSIFRAAPVGIGVVNNRIITNVNKRLCQLLGYTRQELLNKNARILYFTDEDYEYVGREKYNQIREHGTGTVEVPFRCKNGRRIDVILSSTPIDVNDLSKGVTFSVLDITEKNQALARITESEEKLSSFVQQSRDAIVMVNENGDIITWNHAQETMSGYTLNEIKHKKIWEVQSQLSLDTNTYTQQVFNQQLKLMLQGKNKINVSSNEVPVKNKNGKIIYVQQKIFPIQTSKGLLIASINRDVTEQKTINEKITRLNNELLAQNENFLKLNLELQQTNENLIAARNKAEESDRLKSAFLANMSHEIRTPMNGILGFTNLLTEPDLNADRLKKYVGIIQKSGSRMLNTVNDIIEISKIETGQITPNYDKLNLNEYLTYYYDFFKPETDKKNLKFFLKPGLPESAAFINTDKQFLHSILSNLIKNAIKYTNKGSILIGYQHHNSELLFYVKDTGIGIPENRQQAIFERFIQADIEDKKAMEGSGLGLAIVKAYCEMLQGRLWVESKENKGSQFYFTLPYQNNLPIAPPSNQPEKHVIKPKIKNLNILIAEDDEASALHLEILLNGIAKKIFKANTGTQAVEICKQHTDIDIVLMDIKMPYMDGYEATRAIKKINPSIIIIAQTAYALSGDKEKALQNGCNDYISKPIQGDVLYAVLNKYLSKVHT